MKVLLDTNVILDVLLERQPHLRFSQALWAAIEMGAGKGLLAAHALTTIHYLVAQRYGKAHAMHTVVALVRVFTVATVDQSVVAEALILPSVDFEDAVTAAAARAAGCDFIATRDPKGFRGSPVRALKPEAIVPLLVV
jgi:predicted nucleic acid-binding protein